MPMSDNTAWSPLDRECQHLLQQWDNCFTLSRGLQAGKMLEEPRKRCRSGEEPGAASRRPTLPWVKTLWKQWIVNCFFGVKMAIKIDLTFCVFLILHHVYILLLKSKWGKKKKGFLKICSLKPRA